MIAWETCVPCGEPLKHPADGYCPLCGKAISVCRICADDHQNLTCCQPNPKEQSE